MRHEADSPFAKHVDFVIGDSVIFGMLRHCEAKSLTHNIVEGHSQEVAAQEKQAKTVYAVEFSPLGFFFEHFIHLNGLPTFSNLDRQFFFLPLDL